MKTLAIVLLLMATAVLLASLATANANGLIIPNGSDDVDIYKITRSSSGKWLHISVQTGKRGTLKCTALDSRGNELASVGWLVEHRYTVVLLEVGKDADSVKCGW